jgi:Protein of unknown function (DUF3237)
MSAIAGPGLSFVGEMSAALGPPIDVGTTPHGVRRIVPILAGEMTGPRLAGKLLPGGTDYQIWRRDGVTEIHARYVVEAPSGAPLYVEATGLRRVPAAIMERLYRGEQVDQGAIYFRTVPRFETSDPDFAWAMQSIFICAGARYPDRVVLHFFEVT